MQSDHKKKTVQRKIKRNKLRLRLRPKWPTSGLFRNIYPCVTTHNTPAWPRSRANDIVISAYSFAHSSEITCNVITKQGRSPLTNNGLGSIPSRCHSWGEFVLGSPCLAPGIFLRIVSLHKKPASPNYKLTSRIEEPHEPQLLKGWCGFLSVSYCKLIYLVISPWVNNFNLK